MALSDSEDRAKIKDSNWNLTLGRYISVVLEKMDKDFKFEETLREIHVELENLIVDAVRLVATIKKNLKELGV